MTRCTYCRDPLHRASWVSYGWQLACVPCGYALAVASLVVDGWLGIAPWHGGDA